MQYFSLAALCVWKQSICEKICSSVFQGTFLRRQLHVDAHLKGELKYKTVGIAFVKSGADQEYSRLKEVGT